MSIKATVDYSLYLITDRESLGGKPFIDSIESAVKGGATLVQLREKSMNSYDYYNTAVEIKRLLKKYGIPLIINDRVDIALAVGADGVHLGPEDLPVNIARELLGPGKIIGASANCIEEALSYQKQGADYLGVGALYATETKKNTEHVSLDELESIKNAVNIPIVGIGGINLQNAPKVKATGVDGIAVASAVLGSQDPFRAAFQLKNIGNM